MPVSTSKKYHRLCMYDMDVFSYVAERLAREYEEVYYYAALQGGPYPKKEEESASAGLPHVIRVNEEEWYTAARNADVLMFPYLYSSGLQEFLGDHNYPVWGSGHTSYLELDRWRTHTLMHELGMPVPNAELVYGIDDLCDLLHDRDDCYVKISYWRGNAETWHHEDMHVTEGWIHKLKSQLGPLARDYEFIVEDPINDAIEVGYDGYCVRGTWSPIGAIGYEAKNQGYLGKVLPFDEIPGPIRYGLETIGPLLSGVSTSLSNEVRVTKDGTPYVVDWTMRGGSPPSECVIEAFSNWGEIIYEGARGAVVQPEPTCRYFAQLQVHSNWIKEEWMPISYPHEIDKWIKCYSKVEVDGKYYVPTSHDTDICAVTAVGDTMEATVEQCLKRAKMLKGIELEIKEDVFNDIFDSIEEGRDHGIDW